MNVYELNMDGLVGPTHHYAGLATGNLASTYNAQRVANPLGAAKQGLAKMRMLHDMGIKQAILPPHPRPNLVLLHELGFTGTMPQQISKAARDAPELLSICYSASSMWTANAATVSASSDCADGRVHFSAANLVTHLHRSQEAAFSYHLLKQIFNDNRYFQHHHSLPASMTLGDEGAANHCRLAAQHGHKGVNLFVYGKKSHSTLPRIYPARQTFEASSIIARRHGLQASQVVFACQNPDVIDLGVFHNDVISLANAHTFLVHERAFVNQHQVIAELREKTGVPLCIIEIPEKRLAVADAVATYLFNSQLISLPDGAMTLISPLECYEHAGVNALIEEIIASTDNPIESVHYLDLKQSMRNGGGPACLRLRVPLTPSELDAMHQGVMMTPLLFDALNAWVDSHYRDRLAAEDLASPEFARECMSAREALEKILSLDGLYR